ncbi:MAG: DciA family protein [Woeseia sp.]
MSTIKLDKLLKSGASAELEQLVRHAEDMDGLTRLLRAALPADAAPHLVAANLRDQGELVLICSSSSWAARVRFESKTLLTAAQKAGVSANRCSVKVGRGQ